MFAFADGKGTSGFVHHDDFGADSEGGGDLGHLFLGGGEEFHVGLDVEGGLDFVEHLAGAIVHGGTIDDAELAGEFAEAKVFGDGEVWAEGQFLVNHGDAEAAGGEGIGGVNKLAVEDDLAGISGVNAGEDFAEGAFACAIFTHQGVTLTLFNLHGNVVEGEDAWEPLRNVSKFEERHGS